MTNRHDWDSEKIIKAFYGQATVEGAFKNLKNLYHLAVIPGFHWTDQKIKIHYMLCVIGYLLSSLLWYDAKKAGINIPTSLGTHKFDRRLCLATEQGDGKRRIQIFTEAAKSLTGFIIRILLNTIASLILLS